MIRFPEFTVRYAPAPVHGWEEAEQPAAQAPAAALMGIRLRTLLVIFLMLSALYTAFLAKTLLLPIILALFLAICTSPLVKLLARALPRALAALLVVSAVVAGFFFACAALTAPVNAWLEDAAGSAQSLAPKVQALARPMEAFRRSVESVLTGAAAHRVQLADTPGEKLFDPWGLLMATPKIAAWTLSVILLYFFFLAYGADIFRRAVELTPTLQHKKRTVAIVRAIQADTARYLGTVSLINLCLGVATTLMAEVLGLPAPWVFGLVAGLLNFIPYVGPIATTALLAGFGLLYFDRLGDAAWPPACFAALAVVEGQFVSPWILGRYLSLSPVAILLWLMLWGWIWGIGGIFLGVPMLMVLKIVCERFDNTQWISRAIE